MPSTSTRGTAGSAARHDLRRDGEASIQRRHPASGGATGTTIVETTAGTEVADVEQNSTDEADQSSGTEARVADHDQIAQDLAQMLDVGVRSLLLLKRHQLHAHRHQCTIVTTSPVKPSASLCLQSIISWAEQSILPFLALLLTHLFVQHFYSFIQVSLLLISTASSILHLQAVVAAPLEHKLVKSRDVLILVNLNIWALSLLGIPDKQMWQAIFLQVSKESFTVRHGLRKSVDCH